MNLEDGFEIKRVSKNVEVDVKIWDNVKYYVMLSIDIEKVMKLYKYLPLLISIRKREKIWRGIKMAGMRG